MLSLESRKWQVGSNPVRRVGFTRQGDSALHFLSSRYAGHVVPSTQSNVLGQQDQERAGGLASRTREPHSAAFSEVCSSLLVLTSVDGSFWQSGYMWLRDVGILLRPLSITFNDPFLWGNFLPVSLLERLCFSDASAKWHCKSLFFFFKFI